MERIQSIETDEITRAKINLETARMPWHELQRFFAAGKLFKLDSSLDLTKVALRMSQDDSDYVKGLVDTGKLAPATDSEALEWTDNDALLWTVVVNPFVLVQEISPSEKK